MPALKSDNPTNAMINRNFVIRVLVNPHENHYSNTKLTTAKRLSNYLHDDKLKIKLFNKVLDGQKQEYVFLIRKRLKINFRSK